MFTEDQQQELDQIKEDVPVISFEIARFEYSILFPEKIEHIPFGFKFKDSNHFDRWLRGKARDEKE